MNLGTLWKRAGGVWRFRRDHGTKAAILRALNAMLNPDAFKKHKVVDSLAFTRYQPFGSLAAAQGVASNTVNWFIPRPGRGSGGHLNIFRFVRNLEAQGFECRIISTVTNLPGMTPEQMEADIANWFFPLKAKVYILSLIHI